MKGLAISNSDLIRKVHNSFHRQEVCVGDEEEREREKEKGKERQEEKKKNRRRRKRRRKRRREGKGRIRYCPSLNIDFSLFFCLFLQKVFVAEKSREATKDDDVYHFVSYLEHQVFLVMVDGCGWWLWLVLVLVLVLVVF